MRPEYRLTAYYLLFGFLWILLSDSLLLLLLSSNGELLHLAQTSKGMVFILITAGLLFALLRYEFRQRRQARERLRQSEEHFRMLFLNNPQPMWLYDLETLAYLEVNRAAVERYGYTAAEFLSMRITDIRPPEDVPRLLEDINNSRPDYQRSGEWRHLQKDGSLIYVEINSHRMDYEGRLAALVVIHDVTERIQAREALAASEQRLNSILDTMEDVVWSMDSEQKLLYINRACLPVYGRPPQDFYDNPGLRLEMVHPEDRERVTGGQRGDGTSDSIEYRIVRPDGEVRWLYDRVWMTRSEDGRVERIDGIVMDITARRQLEEEVLENERMRLALRKEIELRELRNRFVSMISHEFRTPLTTIQTSADMLSNYSDRLEVERKQRHFEAINTQIRVLIAMLDDILAMLKTESIGPDFTMTRLDLVALCRELVEEAQFNAQRSHKIHLRVPEGGLHIPGDERLLRQALGNLLSNAVKYSPNGGLVTVELVQRGKEAVILVQDQGIGIPQQDLDKLFDAFQRGSNTGRIPGTGLGLAITSQAVRLHGGRVEVESGVGRGTTLRIILPLAGDKTTVPADTEK